MNTKRQRHMAERLGPTKKRVQKRGPSAYLGLLSKRLPVFLKKSASKMLCLKNLQDKPAAQWSAIGLVVVKGIFDLNMWQA